MQQSQPGSPQRVFTPHNAPIKDAKLLPAQAPVQIFGRNRELGSGHVALKAGTAIFLYGPPGVGKTALAAVLASAYTLQNPGGVLWFNMTEDDADLLLVRVGRAYGVNALTAYENPAERLAVVRALLERNRPLIVLDGLTDADAVRDFARSTAAGIPLIVTDDTQAAGPWTPIALFPLSATDSAQMLRALANVSSDATYNDDIDGLCRILGGSPLALELAARHMAADDVKPAELLTRLLSVVPPGVGIPDPQQTILAVIYKQLPATVQAIFLMLGAAFAGNASTELIADMSNVPAAQLIPIMRQLVVRGLAHESIAYGQVRYTLHESVQLYVRGILEASQRLHAVENRILQAVVAYTLRHARPDTANQDRLAAEMENIIGAAAFATSVQQEPPVRQLMLALTQQAGDFIMQRGFQPEITLLRRLLSLVGRPVLADSEPTGEPSIASTIDLTTEASTEPTQPSMSTAATPAVTLSEEPPPPDVTPEITSTTAPTPESAAPAAEPIKARQFSFSTQAAPPPPVDLPADTDSSVSPTASTPAPLPDYGMILPYQTSAPPLPLGLEENIADEPEPESAASESAAPAPAALVQSPAPPDVQPAVPPELSSEIPTTEAEPFNAPPDLPADVPEPEPVVEVAPAVSLTLAELVTPQTPAPQPSAQLATTAANLSVSTLQSRISDAQKSGDTKAQAAYLQQLGDAYQADNDAPRAITAYTQAVEAMRGGEDWIAIGLVMEKLGTAYLAAGRAQEGALMLEQALTIFRRERNTIYQANVLESLASAYNTLRNWPKAQENHEQALYLARERNDQLDIAILLGNIAYFRELQGDFPGAINYYRQGLDVAYALRDNDLAGDYAYQLGRLLLDDKQTLNQAVQLLQDADTRLPDDDNIQRSLKRAQRRLEHLKTGGIDIPAAQSNTQYAANAAPAATH